MGIVADIIIETIFSFMLFINALLFIPQAMAILKKKSTEGVSLITFMGFLIIQLFVVFHGIINQDYLLSIGYALSLLTCGFVVILILIYKNSQSGYNLQGNLTLEEILEQLPAHIYWKNKNGVFVGYNMHVSKEVGLTDSPHCDGVIIEEEKAVDGKVKVHLSQNVPLLNRNKEVIGIFSILVDITEYKKKNIENLDMLENIIALMPGHVYWVNREGYYLGCNDNQAKSAGLRSRKDIIGKRNNDLPWNFNAKVLPETLDSINKEVMDSGREITVEEPAVSLDGEEAIFLSTKVPIYNKANKVIGMVGISIDITARKRDEKELILAKEVSELASKLKDDFILNIEHDMRTPLSAINMIAAQMAKKESDVNKNKRLIDIAVCSKEIMDYCSRSLEYLRAKSCSEPIIEKKFDLKELLGKVINIEKPAYEVKSLDFSFNIARDVPQILIGDDFRLERILINLLSNAIKFTHNGFVKINILVVKKLDNRNIVVQFSVEDSGIGIHESKLNIIYEKFARVSTSSTGLYKGQGLGLTIVKKFTEDMEGEIELQSVLGRGTKFICTYPFKMPISVE